MVLHVHKALTDTIKLENIADEFVSSSQHRTKVELDGSHIQVEAALSEELPVSVLLGTDVPELTHLISGTGSSINLVSQEQVMVVMTRAKAKQQLEEELIRKEKELLSGAQSNTLVRVNEPSPRKNSKLTKDQRREIRKKAQETEKSREGGNSEYPDITIEDLKKLQAEDPTLAEVLRAADRLYQSKVNSCQGDLGRQSKKCVVTWKRRCLHSRDCGPGDCSGSLQAREMVEGQLNNSVSQRKLYPRGDGKSNCKLLFSPPTPNLLNPDVSYHDVQAPPANIQTGEQFMKQHGELSLMLIKYYGVGLRLSQAADSAEVT
ncbi:hypothetical protein EMCRGX_G024168 [Ephydatia muelleri]